MPDSQGAAARWRPMRADEIGVVKRLSDAVHAGLPERIEVLADKRKLFPQGAFALERWGETVGYALAHPWTLGSIPALDSLIDTPPFAPDCLYLHDVAILPDARGRGCARALVDLLRDAAARAGLRTLALTSVYGTHDFWASCGFAERDAPGMAEKLATYGGPARYMTRAV